jgi:hypothetical protein
MPLETFTVVNGSAGLSTNRQLVIDPVPTLPQVHATAAITFVEFVVPAGGKSEVTLNILNASSSGSSTDPVVKRSPQIVTATETIDLIYLLEGLHALRIDANGVITITEVNDVGHPLRQQFPDSFPNSVRNRTVSPNGQVSDTLFIATVIRAPRTPRTIQPSVGGAPIAPPYDAVLIPAYSFAAYIDGKIFVETLESPPAEEDETPVVQSDQGPALSPDLDYQLEIFRAISSGEVTSDTINFIVTVSVKNISAVNGDGVAINFFRVDPTLGDVFLTSGGILGLSPGERRSISTGLRLRASSDIAPIPAGNHIIKAQLGNTIIPNVAPVAYSDANSENDSRTITMRLLGPGESPSVLPPPSASGSGSSNDISPFPTGNQVNVVVDGVNSQSLYGIQPGDEFQSNWIETNVQAIRVAESIIWQKNQVLTASFTVPYNPDVRRGMTVSLRLDRINFSMLGLVKTVGHTFSGSENRPASTQVVMRATEYIFESSLAELGLERFDERQVISVDSLIALASF